MSVNNALDVEAQVTALRRVETKLAQYITTSVTTSEDNRETERIIETRHAHVAVAHQFVQSAIFALENPDQFAVGDEGLDLAVLAAAGLDIAVPAVAGDGFTDAAEDEFTRAFDGAPTAEDTGE